MLQLRALQPSEFQRFIDFFCPIYADTLLQANIANSYVDAYRIIESDLKYLFPNGEQTPDQHIYDVYRDSQTVGVLWLGDRPYHRTPYSQAWIYYIEVVPQHRSEGIGSQILQWAEEYCAQQKIPRLGLNVFAHNPLAKKLYERVGFKTYASCPHPNDPNRIYRYEMSKVVTPTPHDNI